LTELTLKQGSREWQDIRTRALNDLFFFTDTILGYGPLVPMTLRAHYLMCRFAEQQTGIPDLDNAWVRLIKVPRGVGKSTIITQGFMLQRALKYPDIAMLVVNETERGATKFLAAIKNQIMDNQLLRALFPERCPSDPEKECAKWSESEIILPGRTAGRKESTIQAIGVGGSITGLHPDLAVIDDMISDEAAENARAGLFSTMEKTNRWISRLRPIVNTGQPHFGLVWVGTPWWEDDSYTYVEKAFGYGDRKTQYILKHETPSGRVQVPAYRTGDIAVFARPILEDGTSWFPERWPDEKLAKMRVDDPLLFAANMMLDPRAPEITTFKPEWRRYYTWANGTTLQYRDHALKDCIATVDDLNVIVSVDPAFSEVGRPQDARQAIIATGGTEEGYRMLLRAKVTRQTLDGFIADIVETCKTFKAKKLRLEKAGQQAAFNQQVRRALNDANIMVSVLEETTGSKNKDVRIEALSPYFERGMVYGDRNQHDFWREYDTFPRGKLKDLLDALSAQITHWQSGQVGSAVGNKRVQQELDALYARMGVPAPAGSAKDWRTRVDGSRR